MPELSVVIPTLCRTEFLIPVLEALDSQEGLTGSFDVIVAKDDDADEDGLVAKKVAAMTRRARVVSTSATGPGVHRNAGWRAADSTVVLFLDEDVRPSKRLVAEHLEWHQRHPTQDVGVLGLVRWAPELEVTPFMRWLDRGIQFDYMAIDGIEAGWGQFYTCNVSVKRDLLERVDGFDEEFPFGYEDLDIGRRMSEHGLRLLYNQKALGDHLRSDSEEAWMRRMPMIAAGERRFVQLYPGTRPYFHDLFRAAAGAPPPRGYGARLARWISPRFPLLGPRVWASYDAQMRRALAPSYLSAWDDVGPEEPQE